MVTQDKQNSSLTLDEAFQTLSEIVNLDLDYLVGTLEKRDVSLGEQRYQAIHWLKNRSDDANIDALKAVYQKVLASLCHHYQRDASYIPSKEMAKKIQDIMLLVGEAAEKLDKCTQIFHLSKASSVRELQEFKGLQDIYQNKFSHKIDEAKLGKWILELSKIVLSQKDKEKMGIKDYQQAQHVFVDLDSVRRDTEYELLFLLKEDGTRFFSPRLLRNMRLASEFDPSLKGHFQDDELEPLSEWADHLFHTKARHILEALGALKDDFFHEAYKFKDSELVKDLCNCLMALTLCANPKNSLKVEVLKSSFGYFHDFQLFLRNALQTEEYASLVADEEKGILTKLPFLLQLTHILAKSLYFEGSGYREVWIDLEDLLDRAENALGEKREKDLLLWSRLNNDYAALTKLFKNHQGVPLAKILKQLEGKGPPCFDPLLQHTMQTQLYKLSYGGRKTISLALGCPVLQEFVHKAEINSEFKELLREGSRDSHIEKILLINLQDRTSWKERARSTALEELQNDPKFKKSLCVVSLARGTDFYYQIAPYDADAHMDVFLERIKSRFGYENSGYYIPENIETHLRNHFLDGVLLAIHKVFYGQKNVLLRDYRLDFIEIFDLLLTLKIIEMVNPDAFAFVCKDGVDASSAANALLFCFLKMVNSPDGLNPKEWEALNSMLHTPALIVRERLINQDVLSRFISALRMLEAVKNEYSREFFIKRFHEEFSPLYSTPILKGKILLP